MELDGRAQPDEIDQRNLRLAEELESLSATGDASSYAPRSIEEARALAAKGIKGIRYLDEQSRGNQDGTRNYVVFDEDAITIEDILAANPLAGALITPGAGAQPQGPTISDMGGRPIPPEEEAQRQALIRYLQGGN
jgi:hypothetical protein